MKFLVFGLGNPGSEYADTRHNVGFMVLDRLRKELSSADDFASGRYASVCNGRQAGKQFVLVKPQTYMNLSGQAVRYWMQTEKVENDRILVITDDLSLPFGQIRLRGSGSAGGHNGLGHIETVPQQPIRPLARWHRSGFCAGSSIRLRPGSFWKDGAGDPT